MSKKNLFFNNEHYTDAACELSTEAEKFLMQLIEKYSARGYKIREIQYVIQAALDLEAMSIIIMKDINKRQKKT